LATVELCEFNRFVILGRVNSSRVL
jgi:hypothetical protein